MSAGIKRVHGTAILPSQRPSTISFYTITFPSADVTAENGVVDGVFDQIFRTAVPGIASIAMIGTPVYSAGDTTVPFAIEDTGADALSLSYLGTGNDNAGSHGDGATTALALRAVIRALDNDGGTASGAGVNNIRTNGVTVAAGIRGVAF